MKSFAFGGFTNLELTELSEIGLPDLGGNGDTLNLNRWTIKVQF